MTEQARVKLREAREAEELKDAKEERKAEEACITAATVGDTDDTKCIMTSNLNLVTGVGTGVAPKKTAEEVKRVGRSGDLSLETLAQRYLDHDIQTKGKRGHDSPKDAVTARDLVHQNVLNLIRK
jgi:hypothetical protein